MTSPITACIYTRISSDPDAADDDGGQGVTRQEQDCRALAERRGWTVGDSDVYTDNDISAYSGKTRPRFDAMLDGIKRGQFDVLVCWHTDRLYRSMRDLERVIEVCDAANVTIHTVNGGDLDLSNATGKMLARILGSVSRQESEHKAERQRRANIQRAEAGGWWSSHRVFGYNRENGEAPTICEAEAALIRRAASDVLAGVSLRAICRGWNSAGITSTRGANWNGVRLKRLLMNPRYCGLRTYHGKVVGHGDWPAILDPDTHAGLVAVLSDSSRAPAPVNWERRYIGSHRYVCGRCGALMQHTIVTQANGRRFHRYACTASAHLARSQPELDALVERVALDFMRDQDNLAAILVAKASPGVDPADLRTRRAALAAQRDELATLFTDGVLDGAAVRRESGKLAGKIATIDSALAELARRSPLAELLAEGAEKMEQRWSEASPDIKGKVIDELFTVVVNPAPKGRYFKPEFIDFRWIA